MDNKQRDNRQPGTPASNDSGSERKPAQATAADDTTLERTTQQGKGDKDATPGAKSPTQP